MIAPPLPVEKTFVRVLGEAGKRQLRVSEESRYTHIKFLLNGAGDIDVEGDDTVMVHDKSEHSRESLVGSAVTTRRLRTCCRERWRRATMTW